MLLIFTLLWIQKVSKIEASIKTQNASYVAVTGKQRQSAANLGPLELYEVVIQKKLIETSKDMFKR